MKSEIQLSVAKLHIMHVLQSDNADIWNSEWYTASNIKRDYECTAQ